MKKILFIIAMLWSALLPAQQFINAGIIEYEVRNNTHKAIGDDGFWAQAFKDRVPQFSTSYYRLMFADNKAVYKLDRKDEKSKIPWDNGATDDDLWFSDYNTGLFTQSKFVFDNTYLMDGKLLDIEWKLSPTETRVIAGFSCRKATGIIFDSVYVFAFYTEEITANGGPMGLHGLPGMILGVTIPRLYTSWIATKLELSGVDQRKIAAPTKGRKKESKELQQTVEKAVRDWGPYGQQQIWKLFL